MTVFFKELVLGLGVTISSILDNLVLWLCICVLCVLNVKGPILTVYGASSKYSSSTGVRPSPLCYLDSALSRSKVRHKAQKGWI